MEQKLAMFSIIAGFVKIRKKPFFVIPANTLKGTRAGIRLLQHILDTGVRRCDAYLTFCGLVVIAVMLNPMIASGAQKTITTYTWDTSIGAQATPQSISFANDLTDFKSDAATPNSVVRDNTNKTVNIGNNITSCAVIWYGGNSALANCTNGRCDFENGFRAYFDVQALTTDRSSISDVSGDGFTFAIISGVNNTINKRGGPPGANPNDSNKYNMGELLCYGGSGNTGNANTDGRGLRPPKMAIEFDTSGAWDNDRQMTDDGCSPGRYDQSNYLNHISLIFWGNDTSGNCSSSSYIGSNFGNNYPKISYDDNIHKIPATGTTSNPRNSYSGETDGGYCQRTGGKVTVSGISYNWLEDPQVHRVRVEVTRATTAAQSGCGAGTYAYNIKTWVDCEAACCSGSTCASCPASEIANFQNIYNAYSNASYLPKINRTVCLSSSLHTAFDKMIFGFTGASTGATQNVQFSNFNLYFIP